MTEIFVYIMQIAERENAIPVQNKVWDYTVDETWKFSVNGFTEEKEGIPPFTAKIEYNGWPAGLINPYGGIIAAGEGANEDTFIQALQSNLAS